MARAGEAVELAERQGDDRGARGPRLGRRAIRTRPVATIDVRCSAGTYIRALARDLGAAVGSAAYLGALVRTASGPFTMDQAIALDDVRAAAAEGPERLASLLLPVDAGLDALPEVVATDDDVVAIARGQFVRAPGPLGDGPIRVRDANGTLVAIARYRDGRLAPDKVLIDAPSAGGARPCLTAARSRSPASTPCRPATARSSPSSACSTASTSAIATCCGTSSYEAERRRRARGGHHVRRPPRRGDPRRGAAAPARPGRPAAAARRGGRRRRRRPALRRRAAGDGVRRVPGPDHGPDDARRAADDAGRRVRPRPAGHAGDRRGARVASRASTSSSCRRSRSTGGRSAAPTSGRRSPAGDLAEAAQAARAAVRGRRNRGRGRSRRRHDRHDSPRRGHSRPMAPGGPWSRRGRRSRPRRWPSPRRLGSPVAPLRSTAPRPPARWRSRSPPDASDGATGTPRR